jgi:hypothetical protein
LGQFMGLAVRIEVPGLQPYHYNAALPRNFV